MKLLMSFLLSQYLALTIFNLKLQFCDRNSSDILFNYIIILGYSPQIASLHYNLNLFVIDRQDATLRNFVLLSPIAGRGETFYTKIDLAESFSLGACIHFQTAELDYPGKFLVATVGTWLVSMFKEKVKEN